LAGLIAEGGQGMRTANNARFVAYFEGTPQARELQENANEWNTQWLKQPQIASVYLKLIAELGGDPLRPLSNRAAWEGAVHKLREQFKPEQLRFGRMALFRIAPKNLVATESDYRFAFDQRKRELLHHWQERSELNAFWNEPIEISGRNYTHGAFWSA